MWKIFEQIKSTIKDIDVSSSDSTNMLLGISDGMPIYITPRYAYSLSERNSDLGTAVSKISKSISNFSRILRVGEDVIQEHPFLDILNTPGAGYTGKQFWKELMESFLLTQEGWIVARGLVNSPPKELVFMRPYEVDVTFDGSNIPKTINTNSKKDRKQYFRVAVGNSFKFYDKEKLNELIPIIGTVSILDEWRGRSPLAKLFYDLKMNTDGKRHNVSLINNGMRTTGILSPKPGQDGGSMLKWTPEGVKNIAEKLRAFHQGPGNAGNVLVMSTPTDLKGITQTNKQMDYANLLKNSQVSIYNLYEIPLPIVLPDTMTLDNYKVAYRAYYTEAVYPNYEFVADGIISAMKDRYKLDDNHKLSFNESAIRAMQPILFENMKTLKDVEAMEQDEIRSAGGFKSKPGGDVILISANRIPQSSVGDAMSFENIDDIDDTEDIEDIEDDPGTTEE